MGGSGLYVLPVGHTGMRWSRLFVALLALANCDTLVDAAVRPSALDEENASTFVAARARSSDIPGMVARVEGAVVDIIAVRSPGGPGTATFFPSNRLFDKLSPGSLRRDRVLGSGFIIDAEGIVLTNDHVVEDAETLRVRLMDRREVTATVLGHDRRLDVALLKLEGVHGLPVAHLGASESTRVGDQVIAIGNPYGLGRSVTVGVISALPRTIGEDPDSYYLQTDAAINPGNSGGPLFDTKGRVVGINTAISAHGRGMSFAIPIDEIRPVLDKLRSKGRLERGRLGVIFQTVTPSLSRAMRLPGLGGALVTELEPKGPADVAGIEAGDVITAVAGQELERSYDLLRFLGRLGPGEKVELRVIRKGEARAIKVELGRSNEEDEVEAKKARPPAAWPMLGMRTSDAQGMKGARVEAVEAASPAAEALTEGDVIVEVNGTPVRNAVDLARRMAQMKREGAVFFRVRRGSSFLYVGVDLG